jgi:erythromycin esterase-like protein
MEIPFAARSIPPAATPAIIAIGEASHGNERMLRERNRVIMELAAAHRISWVALETGFAEARLLDRFVKGGHGEPEEVAKLGFTSGFGHFSANVALLEELRAHNLALPVAERIGIAGVDLSLGGPFGSAPTMAPVECALEGIAAAPERERLRTAFAAAVQPGLGMGPVSDEQKTAFHRLSDELAALTAGAASRETRQCASIVRQSASVFDAIPGQVTPGRIPQDAWVSVSRRDAAMAANAADVFAGSRGKSIVLFAHSSHVMAAPMRGGRWSTQAEPPTSMGELLRERFGDRYVVVAQVERTKHEGESVPDLFDAWSIACQEACLVPTGAEADSGLFRVGINGDDEQVIDPSSAATFLVILPGEDSVDAPPRS